MKTLNKIVTLTLALAAVTATTTFAQTESSPKSTTILPQTSRLSVGPEAGITIGDFNDSHSWMLGGSAQIDVPIASQLYFTGNAGFNNYFGKDVTINNTTISANDAQLIPVKVGLRYYPAGNFYIQGQAGASFLVNKDDIGATKSASFVYTPQVGYLIPLSGKNYLDAGVRFESNSKWVDGGKSNNFFGLRIAYAFDLK